MIDKYVPLFLGILFLAFLELKLRLFSGYAPDLFFMGILSLAGFSSLLFLIFLTLIGFFIVAGPMISSQLIAMLVVISFVHFLRLSVFGRSALLTPAFVFIGVSAFYLITVGLVFFTSPLFLIELLVASLVISSLIQLWMLYA